jgi:hypothetical protein
VSYPDLPRWRHGGPCVYCPQHGPACVSCDSPTPAAPVEDWPVCAACSSELTRLEIAADPYYRGDYYAQFGDDA